jgi:menaquinone-specific isochorismate synthase
MGKQTFNIYEFLDSGVIMSTEPGKLVLGWGKQTQHATSNDNADFQFYFPDFFLSEKHPWIIFENNVEMTISELLTHFETVTCTLVEWNAPSFTDFEHTFNDLEKRFASGELRKAVPFLIESSTTLMDNDRKMDCLRNLLIYAQSHPVYVYGIWSNHSGILGATPEILFKQSKQLLETMACAGTRSVKQGNPEFLLQDEKELHEHQLVIQGIEQALTPFATLTLGQTHLLHLPNLTHLVTPIHAQLYSKVSLSFIVEALHPTPALGAWPRERGMMWLKQYQQQINRKRFGAPIGFLENRLESATCYVAIRNVQWDQKGMEIMAGCGVVPESKLQSEWQEIQSKISAIKGIMKL